MSRMTIDCPKCKARVVTEIEGEVFSEWHVDEDTMRGEGLQVGKCPQCLHVLAAFCRQTCFERFDGEDEWSEPIRVFPNPGRVFASRRIPSTVRVSFAEAESCMGANLPIAACAMLGRTVEAICRDILKSNAPENSGRVMLAQGIQILKERELIDKRFLEWSEQLHAFRNIAAHPDDSEISIEDAQDLLAFVEALIGNVYELTDRYERFKARIVARNPASPPTGAPGENS